MNREEAKQKFASYLVNECPECNTPPEALCDKGGVWICLERILLLDKTKKPYPKGIPWGEDLTRDCEEMRRLEQWGIFPGGYHAQNCSIHEE